MNPFTFVIADFGLHNQLQGQHAALFVALTFAASLYSNGYTGGSDYRAYRYVIDYFNTTFGANHDFAEYVAFTFNAKANR